MNNVVNTKFIDDLYSLEAYTLDDFIMRKSQGREKKDYKSETDLIMKLIEQGEQIGMTPSQGTTYYYCKTNEGYKLTDTIKDINEIDIRYYWDTITTLLQKFKLDEWVRKKPPITVVDKKQKQVIEKLKEHHIGFIPLELRHDRLLAGGFHCVTLDLVRDG